MRTKLTYLFILILANSCQNHSSSQNISDDSDSISTSDKSDNKNTLFVREFYFDYNIIFIDSISKIFFHKARFYCATGEDFNNNLPYFRNLKPDYFEVALNTSELLKIIINDENITEHVYLISNNDTITDQRYFHLKSQLLKHGIKSSKRKLTEEEDEIMKSIIYKKEYNPEKVKWKSTLNVPTDFLEKIEINDD